MITARDARELSNNGLQSIFELLELKIIKAANENKTKLIISTNTIGVYNNDDLLTRIISQLKEFGYNVKITDYGKIEKYLNIDWS